jgi:hypothetical protein
MTPPTHPQLTKRRRYLIDGQPVPYSAAVEAADHPKYCIIGDVHNLADMSSNLCTDCTTQLRADLRLIEDRWDNLEDALMTSRRKSDGERPGSSTEGSAAPIDLTISEAMGEARNVVWAIIASISRDHVLGRDGKLVTFRTDEGTWALAGLLARYYVDYIATHPDQDFTERVYRMAWSAGRKVEKAVHPPSARRPIESTCHQWITTEEGGRAPCPGQLEAVIGVAGSKIVECSEDPMHSMPIEKWLQVSGHRATKQSNRAAKLAAKYGASS